MKLRTQPVIFQTPLHAENAGLGDASDVTKNDSHVISAQHFVAAAGGGTTVDFYRALGSERCLK